MKFSRKRRGCSRKNEARKRGEGSVESVVFAFASVFAMGLVVLGLESARRDLIEGTPSGPTALQGLVEPDPERAPEPPQEQTTLRLDMSETTRVQVRALEAVAPQVATPRRSRSRSWSRSRNRYPGPIPTPADWQPPEGPVRIALQAGHWRADEAPRELSGLRGNGTSWPRHRGVRKQSADRAQRRSDAQAAGLRGGHSSGRRTTELPGSPLHRNTR